MDPCRRANLGQIGDGTSEALDVNGVENIHPDRQYIVVALHEGFGDTVTLLQLPLPLRFLVRDELFEWAALGRYLRATKQIRVDEPASRSALRTMHRHIEESLATGDSLVVFPQGSILGVEVAFQPGAFRIAAEGALGHLAEVRTLRNAVRHLLLARTAGAPLPRKELDRINDASARCPNFPVMSDDGHRSSVELNDDPFDVFCAAVSRSTMETLNDHSAHLALCHAPSCGMFFLPANRRQLWCSPRCGNRARVARHAARAGHGQGNG